VHRQDEVRLLDHLPTVEVHVVVVHHERVAVVRLEVPFRASREARRLLMHTEGATVREVHGPSSPAPRLGLRVGDLLGDDGFGIPVHGRRCGTKVPCGHDIREEVVILQGTVLIGTRDPVDMEPPIRVIGTEIGPQAGGGHEHGASALTFQ
jgi:hypothetical protein